jgi:hypothetical protein
MPFDWDAIDRAVKDASKATDDQLASRVSSLTSLTDDDIKALFPNQGDVQKVAKLMSIVNATASENERANALAANIQQLAPVALRLLTHLV